MLDREVGIMWQAEADGYCKIVLEGMTESLRVQAGHGGFYEDPLQLAPGQAYSLDAQEVLRELCKRRQKPVYVQVLLGEEWCEICTTYEGILEDGTENWVVRIMPVAVST